MNLILMILSANWKDPIYFYMESKVISLVDVMLFLDLVVFRTNLGSINHKSYCKSHNLGLFAI